MLNPRVRAKAKGQRQMLSGPAQQGPRPRKGPMTKNSLILSGSLMGPTARRTLEKSSWPNGNSVVETKEPLTWCISRLGPISYIQLLTLNRFVHYFTLDILRLPHLHLHPQPDPLSTLLYGPIFWSLSSGFHLGSSILGVFITPQFLNSGHRFVNNCILPWKASAVIWKPHSCSYVPGLIPLVIASPCQEYKKSRLRICLLRLRKKKKTPSMNVHHSFTFRVEHKMWQKR